MSAVAWASVAAAESPAAPAERVGAFVEAGGGLNFAGEVDGGTGEAEAGGAFGVRGGYRLLPYLSLGAAVELATLPATGLPGGNFTFVGAEVAGWLPLAPVDLVAGLAVGYDLARGTYGEYAGFGGLRWRLGARVPIVRRFALGLDYALVMPRTTDTVESDRVYRIEPAWLHQVSVVAVVPFW